MGLESERRLLALWTKCYNIRSYGETMNGVKEGAIVSHIDSLCLVTNPDPGLKSHCLRTLDLAICPMVQTGKHLKMVRQTRNKH